MKKRHTILIAFVVLFSTYALSQFSQSLSPYVSFAEARSAKGSVQVKGMLAKDQAITYENQLLHFSLRDEKGQQVPVSYRGPKPDNFEHAESVVIIGRYDGQVFTAEKMLVKCPSKYEKKGESA